MADRDAQENSLGGVPHAVAIGMQMVARGERRATACVPYAAHLVGDPDTGVLHGGVITALLDNVSGMAVHSGDDGDRERTAIATLDLRIDYMRPAEPGRDLYAEATCYRRTASVAFVRASAYHDDPGDPVATSVSTFMLGTAQGRP